MYQILIRYYNKHLYKKKIDYFHLNLFFVFKHIYTAKYKEVKTILNDEVNYKTNVL